MMPREMSARRLQLCAEQNHRCAYCGLAFIYNAGSAHPLAPTIEHVIRLADGGLRVWENEVAACWSCNNRRGEIEAVAYYHVVRELIEAGTVMPLETARQKRRHAGKKKVPLAPIATRLTEKQVAYFRFVYGIGIAREIAVTAGQPELAPSELSSVTARLSRGERRRLRDFVGHSVQFGEFRAA